MIPVALYVLATLDALFVGYRDATGRSGQIRKHGYLLRAMLRGVLMGQPGIALIGGVVVVLFLVTPDFDALWRDFEIYGETLLWVFVPYATIALLAFLPRLLPSVDIRSMTNVVVFGPFTAVRPFLVIGSVAAASWRVPRLESYVLSVAIVIAILSLEPVLDQLWKRGLCRPA
ncbi:MAG: hypothetical protein IPK87_14770 [Planctomycetes bacterium]|nr:hypothetical protein [Planctomycetota bacterium]